VIKAICRIIRQELIENKRIVLPYIGPITMRAVLKGNSKGPSWMYDKYVCVYADIKKSLDNVGQMNMVHLKLDTSLRKIFEKEFKNYYL